MSNELKLIVRNQLVLCTLTLCSPTVVVEHLVYYSHWVESLY